VDIHDPHGIALLPVGWGEKETPHQADRCQQQTGDDKPWQCRRGDPQEAPWIGKSVQAAPPGRYANSGVQAVGSPGVL
jgi:hypothetical protein